MDLFEAWNRGGGGAAAGGGGGGGGLTSGVGGGAAADRFSNVRVSSIGADPDNFTGRLTSRTDPRNPSMTAYSGADPAETPIYSLRKYPVAALFTDRARREQYMNIQMVVVGSNTMIMALPNCRIIRWRVNEGDPEEIEVTRGQKADDIHRLFLDPYGYHLLICMRSGDCFYLHSRSQRPKKLSSWKGVSVEAVAFDRAQVSETTTKSILVGTSEGEIYEASLDSQGKDRTLTLVYHLDTPIKICALHFEVARTTSASEGQRIFVLAATAAPTRLYSFLGGPTMEALFNQCRQQGFASFVELGSLPMAELQCFHRRNQAGSGSANQTLFALLTEHGIYHGSLQLSSGLQISNEVIVEPGLMPYTEQALGGGGGHFATSEPLPISVNMTEFHFLLLYHDKLKILNRLSGQFVQTIPLDPAQQVLGLVRDPAKDDTGAAVWLYSERSLYQVAIKDEGRDVWRLFLEKALEGDVRKFQDALQHTNSDRDRSAVHEQQALFHFERQEFDKAAHSFARVETRPFEEIALRFLRSGQEEALEIFLEDKLEQMHPQDDKVQQKMLCSWLTQLYLQRFIYLDDPDAERALAARFQQFLEDNYKILDRNTTYQLLSSNGRSDELLTFALLIGDFERVVAHYIAKGDMAEALRTLDSAPFEAVRGLFYKFSSVFMETIPRKTVHVWKQKPELSPTKLIPALVRYNQLRNPNGWWQGQETNDDVAIEYLEHCVHTQPDVDNAIHKYLLLLHAQRPDETSLLRFLDTASPGTFDLQYALRVCTQHKKVAACVRIYSAMKLHEEAVQLALEVDVELAKENADQPEDEEARKRLWLLIAKHSIESQASTAEAMQILDECPLLQIEDILPFFSDFVTINDFKTKIVESLEEYDLKIDQLKGSMEDLTENARGIYREIEQLQERKFIVPANETCALSGRPILSGPFYVFPSGFNYLADALLQHVRPHLDAKKAARVRELLEWLDSSDTPTPDRDVYQAELDSLIAAECPLTGNIMIESIDKPLVTQEELDAQSAAWEI